METEEIKEEVGSPWKKYVGAFITLAIVIGAPKIYTALNQVETEKQIEDYRQHTDIYNQHIANAKANWKLENFEKTITDADEALKISQDDREKAVAHYWKGVGLYRLGKLTEARAEEELAMSLYPEFTGSHVTLAATYADQGDFSKSEEILKKAIVIDQSYPWAYNALGLTYIKQGKIDEGIAEIEKAATLDPVTFGAQLEWAKNLKK